MHILILGALGALGTRLRPLLIERGHKVAASDLAHCELDGYRRCDISEYRQIERVVTETAPDIVYHLAAEFGRMNGEDFYENLWRTNAVGTKNIIRVQERTGFRLVYTSSSEVYGDQGGVITEDVMDRVPINQLGDYAISKWVNELQIRNSVRLHGTETVVLRLFNNYGPGEYYSPYRSVVCAFIHWAMNNIPYKVYTQHTRNFTYVDDTIRTMANVAENFHPGKVYNIAAAVTSTVKDVSDIILKLLNKSDDLVSYHAVQENTVLHKLVDASRARAEIGHKDSVSIEEGLARTVEWQKHIAGGNGA